MCGRFVQERSVTELAELFEAEPLAAAVDALAAPRFNLAPTDQAAVVVQRIDGRRAIAAYRWGLIPHWATSTRDAARTINARAETVATTPAFGEAFRRRRCLVPADGFYEWATIDGRRAPFLIRNGDGSPLVFAGLWAAWRHPNGGETLRTFSIITTAAGDAIRPLHDRMPVALAAEDWSTWLDPDPADPVALRVMLERATDAGVEMRRVSPLVNSVRNQGPDLVAPLAG